MSDLFNQLFINPILNLLIVFFKTFESLNVPYAFGFAIIAVTATIRLILAPLTKKQLESAQQMQKLQPEIQKLSKKHKDDKTKLQQEQMRLYKEAGVNPAAGCLPLLIQMPLFFALFRVFTRVLRDTNGQSPIDFINSVTYATSLHISNLNLSFFSVDLTTSPSQWQTIGIWLLAIPVITGLLQYIQTKQMMAQRPSPASFQAVQKNTAKKTDSSEDMGQNMQKQMAIISPLMIGFFAYSFPIGLALYWNTFTVFGILQQYFINKKHI